jgi:hypothetical protein
MLVDGGGLEEPVAAHRDWIMEQVLATSLDLEQGEPPATDSSSGWHLTEKVPFAVRLERTG